MCNGSEVGSYLRLIDFVYHSTLGLSVIKKKKVYRSHRRRSRTVHGRRRPLVRSACAPLACRCAPLECAPQHRRCVGLGWMGPGASGQIQLEIARPGCVPRGSVCPCVFARARGGGDGGVRGRPEKRMPHLQPCD